MKTKKFLLLFFSVFYIVCFGEINFEYEFSVPVELGNNYAYDAWLIDGNRDGLEELYIFSGENNSPAIRSLAEYDLNGELLSVYDIPLTWDIWEVWGSMYISGETVYYLEVDQRSAEPYIYCDLKVFDYSTMTLIDDSSIEIGMGTGMSGDLFFVEFIEMVETDNSDFLFLGINKYFNFGCEQSSNDPYMYKFSFDDGILGIPEEIPGVGSEWLFPDGANSISSIGYSNFWCMYEPDYSSCILSSVSLDIPSTVTDILAVEHDQSYGLQMKFLNNYDEHYADHGLVVWESLNNLLRCYSPDLSEILWEKNIYGSSDINIEASTCVSTNLGDNFIMYFFNDYFVEIRNRINGNLALFEESQIMPFKILKKEDGDLLFLTAGDSLISVYSLAEEIQVNNDDYEIAEGIYDLCNYPNPFNPKTVISFSLPEKANVDLLIYNTKGQEINRLAEGDLPAGKHKFLWEGKNSNGYITSSGIYFYLLKINGKSEVTGKCLLIK